MKVYIFCNFYWVSIFSPERFIEKVLKNVGREHVDVDNLTPQDLSQLSSLIADALLVVDQDQGPNRALNRDRGPGLRDLEEEPSELSQEASRAEEDETLLRNVPTLNPSPPENTPLALTALHGKFNSIRFFFFFFYIIKALSEWLKACIHNCFLITSHKSKT